MKAAESKPRGAAIAIALATFVLAALHLDLSSPDVPPIPFAADDIAADLRGAAPRVLQAAESVEESTSEAKEERSTMKVHLVRNPRKTANGATSVFETDFLRKYGSGRFEYDVAVVPDAGCNAKGSTPVLPLQEPGPNELCLAVHDYFCPRRADVKLAFPRCRTMIVEDERCRTTGYDFRGYRSESPELRETGSLPLGMRLDAWEALEGFRREGGPSFRIERASERGTAANAIFSENTNDGRKVLAGILRSSRAESSSLKIHSSIARKWTMDYSAKKAEQIGADAYMEVLLDSAFTLAPAGHNPECFRIYEAVEAGSIPVFLRGDLDGSDDGGCRGSLMDWLDCPAVILDSWEELYPTLEGLVADPEGLDDMQGRVMDWYDGHMREAVRGFEEAMLEKTYGDVFSLVFGKEE